MGKISKDLIGWSSSKGMRPTPKNYGRRRKVAIITADGEYKRLEKSDKKTDFSKFNTVRVNKIGGKE